MAKESRNTIVYAVIRFICLFLGYLVTLFNYSNFKELCLTMVIITITIGSDYLIFLLTSEKNLIQFIISIVFFVFSSLFSIFLFLGILGYACYIGSSLCFIGKMSTFIKIKNFHLESLFILLFVLICAYIFEYTGILKRNIPNMTA
ncbi:MAG: hypothetical protein WBL93_12225 [Lutisporaceae bacterium]